jgi:ribosomal protein S18 acetylase RimI-like enzyme
MEGMWTIEMLSDVPSHLPAVQALVREYVLLPDAWTNGDGPPKHLPSCFIDELTALPYPAQLPDGDIAVAVETGQAFGTALLVPFESSKAELKRLYVKSEMGARGVGREIVGVLIAVAKELGYRSVVLDVMPSRTAAIGLYRSFGFNPVPAFRNYESHEMLYFELGLS